MTWDILNFNLEKSHIYCSHKFYFIIVEYKFISYEVLVIQPPSILPLPPPLSVLIVLLVIVEIYFYYSQEVPDNEFELYVCFTYLIGTSE
jgi:hypothetical protein